MPYIIGAILGAIIGYITNWLAIKMLFKPHTEKRIGGIKVPFTPGLIPKEKPRIAKSIAETVKEHLINPESISNSLNTEEVKGKVKVSVEKKISELLNEEGTLEQRLKKILKENYDVQEKRIEDKIYSKVNLLLKDESNKDLALEYILNILKDKLKEEPTIVLEFLDKLDLKNLIETISEKVDKEEIVLLVEKNIEKLSTGLSESQKSIKDVVPEKLMQATENIVYDNKWIIANELCNTLRREEVSYKIKNAILSKIVKGPMAFMLQGMIDGIYEKFVEAVSDHFTEEDNVNELASYIVEYIDKFAETEVSDILEKLPEGLNKDIAQFIIEKSTGMISDDANLELIKNKLKDYVNSFNSYDELISSFDPNYVQKLEVFIKKTIDDLVYSKEVDRIIKQGIALTKSEILSYEISKEEETKKNILDTISKLIDDNYEKFISKDLNGILELVDIETIVEDQINSFEVDYAEKIILGIANKELSAITWLGAVLGGILGILSPLLSSLYM